MSTDLAARPVRPARAVLLGRVRRWLDTGAEALMIAGIFCLAAWFPGSVQLGALLIILGAAGRIRERLSIPWPVLVFLGWALLSSEWSLLPEETLDAVVKLSAVSLAAILSANSLRPLEFARRLAIALGLVCLGSLGLALASPASAFDSQMALQGLTPHKNSLGFEAALSLLTSGILLARRDRHRWLWIVIGLVSLVTLALSTSMTPVLALAGSLFACLVVWFVRRGGADKVAPRSGIVIGGVGALGLLLASNLEFVFGLIGRDTTFTGRTQIWPLVLQIIEKQPITGYGVGAPWREGSPIRPYVAQQLGFEFVTAHNGLLDLALEAGIVGLLVLLPLAAVAFARYLAVALKDPRALWGLAVCVFFFTANLTEAYFTSPFSWLVLCYLWTSALRLRL